MPDFRPPCYLILNANETSVWYESKEILSESKGQTAYEQ